MAKIVSFVEGKDAALIEAAARQLCLTNGGNCLGGNSCGKRHKCRMEGWATCVDDVEIMLAVIRETHRIKPKKANK